MARGDRAKPLYRRVNTRTHGVHHGSGAAARYERRTKSGPSSSMHSGQRHGLDHTPLYRFLLKHADTPWDDVRAAALPRLTDPDALTHIVTTDHSDDAPSVVRTGQSSYFSGLHVDADGILRITAPDLALDDLYPACACCTHTFNGARFTNPFDPDHATMLVDL